MELSYNYYDNYLAHHGIKGMKWGVRRFQRKDGSLTPQGKKRYDQEDSNGNGTKKESRTTTLYKKYKDMGASDEDAMNQAKLRNFVEKALVTTAAVAVTAGAVYAGRKLYDEYADKTIKSNTQWATLGKQSTSPDTKFTRGAFYAAKSARDKAAYKSMFGVGSDGYYKKNVQFNMDRNVKKASRHNAAKTFVELYKNNPEFKDAFNKSNKRMIDTHKGWGIEKVLKKADEAMSKGNNKEMMKSGYDALNIGLATHTGYGQKVSDMFYEAMRKKGYGAIDDVNDRKYSGFNAKTATIFFGKGEKTGVKYNWVASNLTADQVVKAKRFMMSKDASTALLKETTKTLGKSYLVGLGVLSAATVGADVKLKMNSTKDERKQKEIDRYKKHGLEYNDDTIAQVYSFGHKGAKRIQDRVNNKKMSQTKAESIERGQQLAKTGLMSIGSVAISAALLNRLK